MFVKVVSVIAVAVMSAVVSGSVVHAAPAPLEGDSITSAVPGVNSLKSDAAKLVIDLDGMAKRYAKEADRMAGRSEVAGDKYVVAAGKFRKLSEAAMKLKSEARTIKSSSALSKVRKKKGAMHQLASSVYLDVLDKTTVLK